MSNELATPDRPHRSSGLLTSLAQPVIEQADDERGLQQPWPAPIPREALDGLMRAWMEILREQYPGVTWMPVRRCPLVRSEQGGPA